MQRNIGIVMVILLIFFIPFVGITQPVYAYPYQNMEVHFIDVGQGDSMLIKTPEDKNILIDGGPPKAGKDVVTYLKQQNVDKIDLLIATHPDIDHIGGLIDVMKSIEVVEVIDSGKLHSTMTYARYINQIRKQDIPIRIARQNEQINLDPTIEIRILNTYSGAKNNNQSSIAMKLTHKDIDFLLMSDVETKQEVKILQNHNVEAEFIKVAHHGSKTSTSFSFLEHVKPKTAILTYSKKNDYGHPVERVIGNLNRINADVYSTAVFGNLVMTTDGHDYLIMPEKTPIDGLFEITE
ncbi:ComEC/Rec2 family competence protein [Virgibacillus byunsanensis]|uniref:ComEC/Rec2 family competence protein n=1 Tax=Virgibacillus byunsanensis TaxID=570945 RepID=A0ABW3LPR2_9BACI